MTEREIKAILQGKKVKVRQVDVIRDEQSGEIISKTFYFATAYLENGHVRFEIDHSRPFSVKTY
jgi:hypothetical protein